MAVSECLLRVHTRYFVSSYSFVESNILTHWFDLQVAVGRQDWVQHEIRSDLKSGVQ